MTFASRVPGAGIRLEGVWDRCQPRSQGGRRASGPLSLVWKDEGRRAQAAAENPRPASINCQWSTLQTRAPYRPTGAAKNGRAKVRRPRRPGGVPPTSLFSSRGIGAAHEAMRRGGLRGYRFGYSRPVCVVGNIRDGNPGGSAGAGLPGRRNVFRTFARDKRGESPPGSFVSEICTNGSSFSTTLEPKEPKRLGTVAKAP